MKFDFRSRVFVLTILSFFSVITFSMATFYDSSEGENPKLFISNPSPNVNLSITSESNRRLEIDSISFNSEKADYPFLPLEIMPFSSQSVSFGLPDDLEQELLQGAVEVDVHIQSVVGSQSEVQVSGSPRLFDIEYISSTQILYFQGEGLQRDESIDSVSVGQNIDNFDIHLSNKIVSYQLNVSSKNPIFREYSSNNLDDIPSKVNLNTQDLEIGTYSVNLSYVDIAGNSFVRTFELEVTRPPLEIEKVYSKQDSLQEYSYYFNTIFEELVIYTDSKEFAIQFETNVNASCYNEELTSFRDSVTASPVTNQTTFHSIPFSISGTKKSGVWIMCEDTSANLETREKVYLSEYIFSEKDLLEIRHLNSRDDFEITSANPNNLVTSSPVTLEANTNYKSFCEYVIEETLENSTMENVDDTFLKHRVENILPENNGNYDITIQCFDQLYNQDSTTLNLDIDTTESTQLISWSPELSINELVDLEIEISDPSAQCSIPRNSESAQDNLLNEEEDVTPDRTQGSTLYFDDFGPFSEYKTYDFTLKCANSEGRISRSNFNIEYDPIGPQVESVDLFNDEFGPTTFFSRTNYMRIDVNTDSSVEYYIVEFTNSEIFTNSTSRSIEITQNFSQDSSAQIYAVDSVGRESEIFTVEYQIDKEAPSLEIQMADSSTRRIVSCTDVNSGCAEILYGTSSIQSSCLPRTSYEEGTNIDVFGKNYLCVEATDEAGNKANLTEQLTSQTSGPFNPNVNTSEDDNSSEDEDSVYQNPPLENDGSQDNEEGGNENEEDVQDQDDGSNPFDPAEPADSVEEDEFNWLLLSAFGFILLATGAGGYYAYKKGYLDEQLVKMGVVKNKSSSNQQSFNSGAPSYSSIPRKELNKDKFQSSMAQNSTNKGKYDSHIDKLNSFISSTLNKDSAMFDEFEKKKEAAPKSKSSLKETLIENRKLENDEKDSFEEFHKSRNTNEQKTKSKNKKK